MKEINESKVKLLCNLINMVNQIKKSDNPVNLEMPISKDDLGIVISKDNNKNAYEEENDKILKVNLYILIRIYKKEIKEIKDRIGCFGIEEYYEFIESLNLPDSIYELYIRMIPMHRYNKQLSYVTDVPSFMGMAS